MVSPCTSSGSNPNWNSTCATPVPKPSPSPVISVAYALNVLGTRGPRRIVATMHTVLTEAVDEICTMAEDSAAVLPLPMPEGVSGGAAIGAAVGVAGGLEVNAMVLPGMPTGASAARSRGAVADCSGCTEECGCGVCSASVKTEPLILRNKPPRWHDQLQVRLSFTGRRRVPVRERENGGGDSTDEESIVLGSFEDDIPHSKRM